MHLNPSIQHMVAKGPVRLFAGLLALGVLGFAAVAQAETTRIVVIGASNATGEAVGASAAYPALLEGMLKAKGYDVTVVNSAVTGATSAAILGLADSAVTPGTKVVVFDVGAGNDADRGAAGQTAANQAQIAAHIRAHGATPVFNAVPSVIGNEKSNPSAWIQGDPHHHYTAQSQVRIAAALVPKVIAAIGKKK